DRYLAAAACLGVHGAVLANKQDLGYEAGITAELDALARIGYPVLPCCTRAGSGLDALREHLRGETAVLVGQSGAGKSSLLRALVPDSDASVGELDRSDAGRHTTTTARLCQLQGGGALIDSPGVRDFAPALQELEPATLGFIDVARLAPRCRFQDCRHLAEPGCAVRAAVDSGGLSARRYESYRRLRRLYQRLHDPHQG
ncbi:MAG TPA: ribosome small subunit-dependent GTPase A, partial [Steroidobacteraceae bacterium]|nr:ribosome small subunit-dependent GTPase A [Steroidobacteraceae bacterium]